ncbi:MAG: pilus assembly protein FimV [Burkholderiales bacterium]|nr:pilus assembly protein FimV [Burkholderiales bacterium]
MIPRTLASAVVLALASLSANVDAAGLGRLNVQSGLGQPLRAEVEVTSLTREEGQTLSAKLAPPEAFRQAGLEYNAALAALRFAIEPRGGRTFVRITSTQPLNEPFVDLLVELNWATGKFVREYTFLLDPAELRAIREPADAAAAAPAAPATAAPAATPVQVPAPAAAAPAPVAAAPAPAAQPAAAPAPRAQSEAPAPRPARPAAAPAASAGSVEVKRGDTLGNIARSAKPEGVNLDQAMIAIYRANPSAFIDNNLNLLREGAKLTIPDAGSMAALDAAEAGREVKLQAASFSAYRQKLAGAARPMDAPRSGQTAAGRVGTRAEDRSGSAPGDQLRLSRPGSGAASQGGAVGSQTSRAGAGERDVARSAALREAGSRINELEKNVTDLQKLLELKNRSLADVQKQLDDARASAKAVTGQVGTPAPAAKAEAPKAVEPPKVEPPKMEPPVAAMPPPKAEAPPPPPTAEAPPPPPKAAPKVEPAPVETSLVDDLLSNEYLLPGLGGIALLGAGYGFYAMRRRRKVEKFEDSLIAADAFTANSLFGSTGGQSVDTNHSAFASSTSNAAVDVHSTEVDPIAEADVYIAYGREAQAEEILKEALKRQPERQAIRAKLLEIYSGRKDTRAFETVARDMFDMTDGQNEEWPRVATMGLSIDPTNPLYGGGPAAPGSGVSAGAVAAGAAAVAAASASAAAASARNDLDFPEMPGRAPANANDDIPSLDFDLNIDTRIDGAAHGDSGVTDTLSGPDYGASAPGEMGASLDDRFDLPSLDLDVKPSSSRSAGSLDLDLPALESFTQTGSQDMDLSPVSLDLEPATVSADEASAGGAGRWQEMATKLDLASAYEEIGDKEGARELLQEVIKGGDSGQQQKARAMLSKIG